jgi:hypothetical protein
LLAISLAYRIRLRRWAYARRYSVGAHAVDPVSTLVLSTLASSIVALMAVLYGRWSACIGGGGMVVVMGVVAAPSAAVMMGMAAADFLVNGGRW